MTSKPDSAPANELRGEVDLYLEGERFVLRPSYTAIQNIERLTGKTMVQLAVAADENALSQDDCAAVVGEMIRAWGVAVDHPVAKMVNDRRIGELLFEHGLMAVMPRITLVLTMAATGGCLASGEVKTAGTIPATSDIPAVD
tara:strand:- start:3772 stop:4197 length:426 start_codon:yes stop_codon:yes gene_type:complete